MSQVPEPPVNPYEQSTRHLLTKRTGPDFEAVKARVRPPARILFVLSLVAIIIASVYTVVTLSLIGISAIVGGDETAESPIRVNRADDSDDGPTEEEKESLEKLQKGMDFMVVAVYIIVALIVIFLNSIIMVGASKMANLESYSYASAAARLSVIPIISPFIVLGIPFGIWAILVLSSKEVRSAFDK